jgi:CheY-like chemotaxis protein
MHKGSVSVSSEGAGRGSTFILRIDTVSPVPKARTAPAAGAILEPARRILLVEDHSDTRDVLSRLLKSLGCAVTAVASVQKAVEVAERQSFDLLVWDIGLPDGNGMDVMKHMAARHSLQGIALSGYGQDEDLRRSRDAGFLTHLTKPVGLRALEDAFRNAG